MENIKMWGGGIIFIGIILFIAALAQAIKNASYKKCSLDTIATVNKKRRRKTKNGVCCEFQITYSVDGIEYNRCVGAALNEMEKIIEGQQIPVKYKPQNPKKVIRPEEVNPKNVKIVSILAIGFSIVGVLMIILG